MSQAGLMGAAGAAQGLERLLAQRALAQQQAQQEQARQQALVVAADQQQITNQRNVGIDARADRQLDEQTSYRQLQQGQLEQERLRDEAFRQQQLGQRGEEHTANLTQARSIADMVQGGLNDRNAADANLRRELAGSADSAGARADGREARRLRESEYQGYMKQEQEELQRELGATQGTVYQGNRYDANPTRAARARANYAAKTAALNQKYRGGGAAASTPFATAQPLGKRRAVAPGIFVTEVP